MSMNRSSQKLCLIHYGGFLSSIRSILAVFIAGLLQTPLLSDDLTFLPDETVRSWTGPELRPMPSFPENRIRVLPGDDLQSILDNAKPGDVISLAPGIYTGRLIINRSGESDAPISLISDPLGEAIISNAIVIEETWTRADELWQCDLDYTPTYVEVDGRLLQPFNGVEDLLEGRLPTNNGQWQEQVPPEGYCYEGDKLYLKLLLNEYPKQVRIHRPYMVDPPSHDLIEYHKVVDRSWVKDYDKSILDRREGCLIQVKAPHWRIHGIKMDFAPEIGILATEEADDLQLSDLIFTDTLKGVIIRGADDVLVEHCEWHLFPRFQWARWAQSKYGRVLAAWGRVIAASFIEHHGLRHRIINNHAYEGFDLIRPRPSNSRDPKDMSEIAYNVLRSAADECIEFDSKPTLNLRVHHNFVMDAVSALAISPVLKGRLIIDHNIVYQSRMGLNNCALLKWYMIPAWRKYELPTSGVTIVHNTMLNPNKAFVWTGQDHFFDDVLIDNNIFRVWQAHYWPYKGMTLSPNNLYRGTINKLDHLTHAIRNTEPGLVRAPRFPNKPEAMPFVGFYEKPEPDKEPIDFHLASDSPCIDSGSLGNDLKYGHTSKGESSDLGAVEYGTEWNFPRPGPRWMKEHNSLNTAPLPPEIHPGWLGLEYPSQQ